MIDPTILKLEIQLCKQFLNKILSKSCNEDISWEERFDGKGNTAQLVSALMTKEQADLLKDKLAELLPTTVSTVKSRNTEGDRAYRVMVNVKKCQEYLNESAYINCFLNNIRTFPNAFWLNIGEGRIKACYPVENSGHYDLLIKALGEFNRGLNVECFDFSMNDKGELVVIANINHIRQVIDHHKSQCLYILQGFLKGIDGISNVIMHADIDFNSYYLYLIVNNSNEGGLPGLTFQVKDTETYEQVTTCFPDFIQIKPNGSVNGGDDENCNREIGVKIQYLTDMSYLVTRQLHQTIHNARSDFCEQLWTLKTKGSVVNSDLRFFPQDMTRHIYKDICPDNAYLTQEEIIDTILKIEKAVLSEEPEIAKKSNALS
ncbi:hypothetical protein [Legionella tunisiensis]|uniref:hypothetical protein n=1 Tax=Legionella tunisiensis TaxID=1034944 RepID=UPI0002D69CFB|nr:hypothetical protein [Legionella tunisiensis]